MYRIRLESTDEALSTTHARDLLEIAGSLGVAVVAEVYGDDMEARPGESAEAVLERFRADARAKSGVKTVDRRLKDLDERIDAVWNWISTSD